MTTDLRRSSALQTMAELSPAAQAIRAAVLSTYADTIPKDDALWAIERPSVIAALRAAADQVVPEHPMVVPGGRSYEAAWSATVQDGIRAELLSIAAELESAQPTNPTH